MFEYLVIFFCLFCTTFYIFVAPSKLRVKELKKTKNIFEEFVDKDSGYIWSITSKRKKSYKDKMIKYFQKKDSSKNDQLKEVRNN
tara:strand:+ start:1394 stop:1648 length:255 start_codon:yes stop_codon:yes gene_type:complete